MAQYTLTKHRYRHELASLSIGPRQGQQGKAGHRHEGWWKEVFPSRQSPNNFARQSLLAVFEIGRLVEEFVDYSMLRVCLGRLRPKPVGSVSRMKTVFARSVIWLRISTAHLARLDMIGEIQGCPRLRELEQCVRMAGLGGLQ